uniref:Membrane protein FAM159A n=1 Tax=Macrostomum lignano TaxID=282301 RepID=A0A1I8JRW6_9PLAT
GSESAWSPGAPSGKLDSLRTVCQNRSTNPNAPTTFAPIRPHAICSGNYFDGSCRCKRCAPYLAQIMRTRTSGRSIKLRRLKRFSNIMDFLTVVCISGMACLATVASLISLFVAIRFCPCARSKIWRKQFRLVDSSIVTRSSLSQTKNRRGADVSVSCSISSKAGPCRTNRPNCPCCWVDDAVHNADGKSSSNSTARHSGIDIVAELRMQTVEQYREKKNKNYGSSFR